MSCPVSSLWGQRDHCSSALVASHGCQNHCLAAMLTYQQGDLVVEEVVAPVQVYACDPSGESKEECCNRIAG